MSVLDLIDESQVDTGFSVIEAPTTGFPQVFSAELEATSRNFLTNSASLFRADEIKARDKRYRALTGRGIYEDVRQFMADTDSESFEKIKGLPAGGEDMEPFIDRYIENLRSQDAERFSGVSNSLEISDLIKQKAKTSLERAAKVGAGATDFARVSGALAGGVAASFGDFVNLATLPFGAAASSGIVKAAIIEAGINAGVEVAMHPIISEWQESVGNEYGLKDAAANVGIAAAFGAGATTLFKGIGKGYAKAKSLYFEGVEISLRERGDVDGATAAAMEARHQHLEESSPARLTPIDNERVSRFYDDFAEFQDQSLEFRQRQSILAREEGIVLRADELDLQTRHRESIDELDASLNEGRAIDSSRIPVTDAEIRRFDTSRMDDGNRAAYERIIAPEKPTLLVPNPEVEVGAPTSTFNPSKSALAPREVPPTVARQKEMAEFHESPEWKAKERADFEEAFSDPQESIYGDSSTEDLSASKAKEAFAQDEEYLTAINVCGLGTK